ncbi:hypothetical protein T4D_4114, partial [Trichinella pseudospiralis]
MRFHMSFLILESEPLCIWFYVEVPDPLGLVVQAELQLGKHHLLKMLPIFPLYVFGFFVKDQ